MEELSVLFSLPSLILVFNSLLLLLITFSTAIHCLSLVCLHSFFWISWSQEKLLGLISVCDLLAIIKYL